MDLSIMDAKGATALQMTINNMDKDNAKGSFYVQPKNVKVEFQELEKRNQILYCCQKRRETNSRALLCFA